MPSKIPRGKVHLSVLISKELNDKLRKYIKETYPVYTRGLLSIVVQDAIAEYLGRRKQQHASKPLNPGRPTVQQICDELKFRMKSKGFLSQIDHVNLVNIISEVRGSDPRTIRKWIKNLLKLGYIKKIGYYVYEIV